MVVGCSKCICSLTVISRVKNREDMLHILLFRYTNNWSDQVLLLHLLLLLGTDKRFIENYKVIIVAPRQMANKFFYQFKAGGLNKVRGKLGA